jgi:hypothetical protein
MASAFSTWTSLHAKPHSQPMNSLTTLSPAELRRAANLQEKIQDLQKELNQILGATAETKPGRTPGKRKMSAAGKAAIRAAQKARWAKIKGTALSAKPAKKAKRKMSAQGLANIRAGVAKRMKAKKAGKSKL